MPVPGRWVAATSPMHLLRSGSQMLLTVASFLPIVQYWKAKARGGPVLMRRLVGGPFDMTWSTLPRLPHLPQPRLTLLSLVLVQCSRG